jgi:UDP-N-acetylmuramoylalanine--D-glutamate ligase
MHQLITILGAGESGIGAAILAQKLGYEVWLSDNGMIKDHYLTEISAYQIPFEQGGHDKTKILSSHIVVKSGDKLLTEDIIKLVAELAVKNSKAKSEKSVDVIYCKGKFVKKEPGSKPGKVLVDYNNSNKITINN